MAIWRFLTAVIYFYILLLSLRIILSWFQGPSLGRGWELLIRVTDPYLSLFSRFRFLRQGMFDFTPLAAILTLVVVLRVIDSIGRFGRISLGIFLGVVSGAIWSAVAFLLVLFLILAVVRAILLAISSTQESRFAAALGFMVEPAVSLVRRIFPARQSFSDRQYLYLTIAFLFVVRLLGGYLLGLLIRFFYNLPI
ncbi:MAG: YggT family protein [Spirochaetaceae bacterium]|nr:MAG: YggT family protein [Spirochaetaceae bacterium]